MDFIQKYCKEATPSSHPNCEAAVSGHRLQDQTKVTTKIKNHGCVIDFDSCSVAGERSNAQLQIEVTKIRVFRCTTADRPFEDGKMGPSSPIVMAFVDRDSCFSAFEDQVTNLMDTVIVRWKRSNR